MPGNPVKDCLRFGAGHFIVLQGAFVGQPALDTHHPARHILLQHRPHRLHQVIQGMYRHPRLIFQKSQVCPCPHADEVVQAHHRSEYFPVDSGQLRIGNRHGDIRFFFHYVAVPAGPSRIGNRFRKREISLPIQVFDAEQVPDRNQCLLGISRIPYRFPVRLHGLPSLLKTHVLPFRF